MVTTFLSAIVACAALIRLYIDDLTLSGKSLPDAIIGRRMCPTSGGLRPDLSVSARGLDERFTWQNHRVIIYIGTGRHPSRSELPIYYHACRSMKKRLKWSASGISK